MKRHEALHALSHDHQNVLARALRLRRASESDAAARSSERDSFVEFARTRIAPHFEQEEAVLDRAVAASPDPALHAGRERMLQEHSELRAAIDQLESAGPDPEAPLLLHVGELTTAHVRFEERELFELLQDALGERLGDVVRA